MIVASTHLWNEKRGQKIHFSLDAPNRTSYSQYALFGRTPSESSAQLGHYRGATSTVLDDVWVDRSKEQFFSRLLRILDGKMDVTAKWKFALRRAAILAGKSYFAQSMHDAFMYDMIGLEILLATQGDKFQPSVTERLSALFGWRFGEDPEPWRETVNTLYRIRCDFVHDGNDEKLEGQHLLLADELLHNLLVNLCANTKTIKKKDDLIQLATKMEARRVLGMKAAGRPRNLRYERNSIRRKQIKEVEDPRVWL